MAAVRQPVPGIPDQFATSTSVVASDITVRPAAITDIQAILVLHREAFADKFGSAFGADSTRGAEALATAWRYQGNRALRGMLVAEWQGQVVGSVTLRTWEMGEDDSATIEQAFQQVLGVWGAMRSIFVLSLLNHRIDRSEGFITDVAVLPAYRRRGIARVALARAEQEARRLQKRYLGLYVSSTNKGAIALYQQIGFYQDHIRRSWMTRLCFGQRTWLYMRKDLP